jgi:hypothetical protein
MDPPGALILVSASCTGNTTTKIYHFLFILSFYLYGKMFALFIGKFIEKTTPFNERSPFFEPSDNTISKRNRTVVCWANISLAGGRAARN